MLRFILVLSISCASCGLSEPPADLSPGTEELERAFTTLEKQTRWLKELGPPEGARVAGLSGLGGGEERATWELVLSTTLPPMAIVSHYEDGLNSEQWDSCKSWCEMGVCEARLISTREDEPWLAVIAASPGVVEPDTVAVVVRMLRLPPAASTSCAES